MSLHFHVIMDMIIISRILQEIKGRTSTRYRQWILDNTSERFNDFCVISKGKKTFKLWQTGVGFDRNLWNAKAIHYAINYIVANPVRADYVKTPEH
jgi:REP element-mobilizing transposase RayT